MLSVVVDTQKETSQLYYRKISIGHHFNSCEATLMKLNNRFCPAGDMLFESFPMLDHYPGQGSRLDFKVSMEKIIDMIRILFGIENFLKLLIFALSI